MKSHEQSAMAIATVVWVLLAVTPAVALLVASAEGASIVASVFVGTILGAVLWFQAIFFVEASRKRDLVHFSFVVSGTAMVAFVTLAAASVMSAENVGGAPVLTGRLLLYFVGTLASLGAALLSARVLNGAADPGPGLRLVSTGASTAVFAAYFVSLVWSPVW